MTHDEIAGNNLYHVQIKNVESAQNPEIWNFEQNYSGPSGDFAQYLHPLQDRVIQVENRSLRNRPRKFFKNLIFENFRTRFLENQ